MVLPVWAGDFVAISRGCLSCPIRYTQGFNAAWPTFRVDPFWAFVILCLSAFAVARAISCPFRVVSAPRRRERVGGNSIRLRPVPRLSLRLFVICWLMGATMLGQDSFSSGQAFSLGRHIVHLADSGFHLTFHSTIFRVSLTRRSSGPSCAGPLNFFR